jgi:2-iminobutanoate/2-iminopropanoate deaminase
MAAIVSHSNPSTVRPPTGYTHAVEVRTPDRRLVMAGQVGIALDGLIAEGGEAQIAQVFTNLREILRANGMTPANLVKITVFLTDPSLIGAYRSERDRFLGGATPPASTLLIVAGLADPRFLVEVEGEAVA